MDPRVEIGRIRQPNYQSTGRLEYYAKSDVTELFSGKTILR